MNNTKLHKATSVRKCNGCEKEYGIGTTLLLGDGGKVQIGCENCEGRSDILSEIARLMKEGAAPAPQAKEEPKPFNYPWADAKLFFAEHTFDRPGRCGCGAEVVRGQICGKWKNGEGKWQIVRCKDCKDLRPADKRQFEGRMSSGDQTSGSAIAERAGNCVGMWTIIQTARENGDTARMDAAVHAFGSWEVLYSALTKLALSTSKLAESTEMSWLGAWDSACASGFLPGSGPSAMAYLVPRDRVISFDLSYKAYHQLGHRDGVTVTEFTVWACEQTLGLMARPYREALHRARNAKAHATVVLGRIESESNAAAFAAYIAESSLDETTILDALKLLESGGKPGLPREVLSALRSGVNRSGDQRDLACAIAYRLLMATLAKEAITKDEAEVRAARDEAAKKKTTCDRSYRYSVDDVAIVNALLIPEHIGGWLAYDWYFVIDESRPPLYNHPPTSAWTVPELGWEVYNRNSKEMRRWTTTPIGVFAVGRWRALNLDQTAWKWLDIVDVHKRAARGQGPIVDPDGSLSAPEGKSPWASDYYPMVWKTVIRDLFTHGKLPISGHTEAAMAVDANGHVVTGDLVSTSEVAVLARTALERYKRAEPLQIEDDNAPGSDLPEGSREAAPVANEEQPQW
jgi:recombinational DNA repair protein RecT